jgi:hypothetical protein
MKLLAIAKNKGITKMGVNGSTEYKKKCLVPLPKSGQPMHEEMRFRLNGGIHTGRWLGLVCRSGV